jgi:hypothetical protein
MAAFVGFTEKAEIVREIDNELIVENLLNRPQLVTNWTQFVERFGGFVPGVHLPNSVYGYFLNGGSRCYVVSVRTFPKAETTLINAQGKPALAVKARQAGVEGMKMRVRVGELALPAPTHKKGPAKEGDAEAELLLVGGNRWKQSVALNYSRQLLTAKSKLPWHIRTINCQGLSNC